jgi:hypothetical protein
MEFEHCWNILTDTSRGNDQHPYCHDLTSMLDSGGKCELFLFRISTS